MNIKQAMKQLEDGLEDNERSGTSPGGIGNESSTANFFSLVKLLHLNDLNPK